MKLEQIDPESLLVQEGYNVRPPGELHGNAKDIAALMEATGDNHEDPRFIIRYVQNGKGKYTRSHATLEAAKLRKWPKVCAVKATFEAGSAEDDLDLIHSNNSGHPLTRYQQGEVYARLRDGILEDLAEATARTKVGEEVTQEYVRQPMKLEEIAEKTDKTRQHIADCITIYESPEAVGDMIEEGKISSGIVVTAAGWAKNKDGKVIDGKLIAILKAAYSAAKEDGKEKATKQHLDSVKAQFVEQKAVSANGTQSQEGKEGKKSGKGGDDTDSGTNEAPDGKESQGDAEDETPEPPELDLTAAPSEPKPLSQAAQKTLRATVLTVILETDSEIDDDLANRICDRLIDAKLIASELPF